MRLRLAAAGLLIGALLTGLAQVAQLPPWEGFDEIAHYSYIQQVAETGTWPRFGDPSAAGIEDYLQIAPAADAFNPPWSYRRFFAAPADAIARGRAAVHGDGWVRAWRPGPGVNWQAQHPPLYYLLMAPAYLVSKEWTLAAQLFLLRSLSYLMAWAALCLATVAAVAPSPASARPMPAHASIRPVLALAPALWPLLFPGWFPEMARLGNDSLVVLLIAAGWLVLLRIAATDGGIRHHVALAAICALGLLTKVIFLPFAAAAACLLCVRAWQGRSDPSARRRRLGGLLTFAVVTVALCGWWYLNRYLAIGSALGSKDMILLDRTGGLWHALAEHGSMFLFLRAVPTLLTTFLWSGTWSFVAPPYLLFVPYLVMSALLAVGCARLLVLRRPSALDWVPLLTLALCVAALFYHTLVYIAAFRVPVVTAWYLHAFAPVLAVLVGYGLAGLIAWPRLHGLVFLLLLYPFVFLAVAFGLDALFFAGCGERPSRFGYADYVPLLACTADLATVFDRLSVLSFPATSILLFAAGWISMLIGTLAAARCLKASS